MIKKIENLNYYELLEVSPRATKQEIHKAYERIRRVYEPNSIALYSLFTPEESAAMHRRIEEAYRTLVYEDNRKRYDASLRARNRLEGEPEVSPPPPNIMPDAVQPAYSQSSESHYIKNAEPDSQVATEHRQDKTSPVDSLVAEFTGPAIKILREQRGLTIRNIADITKVGSRYLEYIEAECFNKLPPRPYLRGFLAIYAKALGCNPERMTNDFMKRYDATQQQKLK